MHRKMGEYEYERAERIRKEKEAYDLFNERKEETQTQFITELYNNFLKMTDFCKDELKSEYQQEEKKIYNLIDKINKTENFEIQFNENETTFEKENKDNTYINGFALKNSEIYSVSNNTIDNEKESLSKITSFGNAKFESDDNDQIDDDNDENNPFKSENVSIIPNGIKKMVFNETSETILVYSSRNEKISEIIKIINQNHYLKN